MFTVPISPIWYGNHALLQVAALRLVDRDRSKLDTLLRAVADGLPANALPLVIQIVSHHMQPLKFRYLVWPCIRAQGFCSLTLLGVSLVAWNIQSAQQMLAQKPPKLYLGPAQRCNQPRRSSSGEASLACVNLCVRLF